ncbi:hypothetical protein [Ruegeria sp.]|uniref:hypothetical protein n=1 Tax=Ruegeria sp. TaxID=1879320 RepID=UPI003B0030FB
MATDRRDAAWHFEGEFGRSRLILRMAGQGGQVRIKLRLDADGQETRIVSLTPEQAGFLADTLPALLGILQRWQEQQRYGIEAFDPFAEFIEQDEAVAASGDVVAAVKPAPGPTDPDRSRSGCFGRLCAQGR